MSINSSGVAMAVLDGGSQITATSGSVIGTSGMTVGLQQLLVSPSNAQISVGQTQQMSATGLFDGLNQDVTNAVAWSSSNTGTATVDQNGVVTAVASGSANITATSGSFTATVELIVQ